MAGRRPTPTALKKATGNPGKRALNKNEPQLAPGIPTPPEHLTDDARRAWFGLCHLLHSMGVLAKADAMALERLCETYAEVVELTANIKAKGRTQVVETESGAEFERQRPQVAMLADADRRFKSYLIEFGLTPAARSKVNVSEQPEQSAAEGYFSA
jgi:P27 family predicted phage terminase small subunit